MNRYLFIKRQFLKLFKRKQHAAFHRALNYLVARWPVPQLLEELFRERQWGTLIQYLVNPHQSREYCVQAGAAGCRWQAGARAAPTAGCATSSAFGQ